MNGFFSKLKAKIAGSDISADVLREEKEDGYVELDSAPSKEVKGSKITVRPFVIQDFEHIKPVLDCLRTGSTIALVNIKPLKDKDLVELKRAINKLKKTCDAIDGDIAGFGEDWIAAVPSFAHIHRNKGEEVAAAPIKEEGISEVTEYGDDEKLE